MIKNFTLFAFSVFLSFSLKAQLIDFDDLQTSTVTDVDGNEYKTILFNDTWWMAEDLKTKHYTDGSDILQATELISYTDTDNDWDYWTLVPRWCYPNLDEDNFSEYGLLYSWSTSISGALCPDGWSLPDTTDWYNLGRYIVGEDKVNYAYVTRNTPTGGTETVYEVSNIEDLGQYFKTDNGKILGTNKYGEATWVDGGYWPHTDDISNECNSSGMGVLPAGEISSSIKGFGTKAYYWTPNYVNADSSGQGRVFIFFCSTDHTLALGSNHNANLNSVRCIKTVDSPTAISDQTINQGIVLSPNPTKNYINVGNASGAYFIYSIQGTIVKSGSLNENVNIDVNDLYPGVYILKTKDFVGKFVKK